MILKPMDDTGKDLKILNGFLKKPIPSYVRDNINTQIKRIRSGATAQAESTYMINFALEHSADHVVLHDVRFKVGDHVAQIDHLVINRNLEIAVCESKNFSQYIGFNKQMEFLSVYDGQEQGVASPIEQNNRHISILKEMFEQRIIETPSLLGIKRPISFLNIILICNKAIIDRPDGVELPPDTFLIKNEQFKNTYVDAEPKQKSLLSFGQVSRETLMSFAQSILARHEPIQFDWVAKMGMTRYADLPDIERYPSKTRAFVQTGQHAMDRQAPQSQFAQKSAPAPAAQSPVVNKVEPSVANVNKPTDNQPQGAVKVDVSKVEQGVPQQAPVVNPVSKPATNTAAPKTTAPALHPQAQNPVQNPVATTPARDINANNANNAKVVSPSTPVGSPQQPQQKLGQDVVQQTLARPSPAFVGPMPLVSPAKQPFNGYVHRDRDFNQPPHGRDYPNDRDMRNDGRGSFNRHPFRRTAFEHPRQDGWNNDRHQGNNWGNNWQPAPGRESNYSRAQYPGRDGDRSQHPQAQYPRDGFYHQGHQQEWNNDARPYRNHYPRRDDFNSAPTNNRWDNNAQRPVEQREGYRRDYEPYRDNGVNGHHDRTNISHDRREPDHGAPNNRQPWVANGVNGSGSSTNGFNRQGEQRPPYREPYRREGDFNQRQPNAAWQDAQHRNAPDQYRRDEGFNGPRQPWGSNASREQRPYQAPRQDARNQYRQDGAGYAQKSDFQQPAPRKAWGAHQEGNGAGNGAGNGYRRNFDDKASSQPPVHQGDVKPPFRQEVRPPQDVASQKPGNGPRPHNEGAQTISQEDLQAKKARLHARILQARQEVQEKTTTPADTIVAAKEHDQPHSSPQVNNPDANVRASSRPKP